MRRAFFIAMILLACGVAPAAESLSGTTADGEAFRGALMTADAEGQLRFVDGDQSRALSLNDLAYWGALVEPAAQTQLLLAGGGVIVVEGAQIENETVRGKSTALGTIELPIELFAGIMLRPPSDARQRDRLAARVGSLESKADRLLLDNGDELSGTLLGLDDKSAQLETETARPSVDLDKLSAVAFNATLVTQPRLTGRRVLVGLRDGSRMTAAGLTVEKGQARIRLAGGTELLLPGDAIAALQVLGGRVQYLSDLTPTSYKHLPYLSLNWPYRPDRSVSGAPLRVAGRSFAKGLGMHSPARLTYDLPQGSRRFDAEVAIDAEAGRHGSVVFRVFVDDGADGWQQRIATPVVRGGEQPLPISADVSGAKRISLLVDFAERGDELDHADWLNARVTR